MTQKIHARHVLTPEGWARDRTVKIGRDGRIAELASGAPDADTLCTDLLLPAPVNLHSHSFQRALAGLTEARGPDPSDSFWTWRTLMYRFLDQLTPDQVEAIAALAFMEMLEAGFGAVAEFHYLHHAPGGAPYDALPEMATRIVAAADRAGLGLTLLPVLYMQGGCDGRALAGGQRRFGCDLDQYDRLLSGSRAALRHAPDDAALGVAPHSLRAVAPDSLARVPDLCPGAPLHMHLAEQVAEVEEVRTALGARPVEWVLQNMDPGPDWCFIHCTQMTGVETAALAATGAVAGLCPITEASLGDGIFNAVAFAAAGGRFGVGSDSNIHISLLAELSALDYSQRLRDHTRAALATPDRSTGRVLYDAALAAGAQAAGRASGALAPGHWADLVAIDTGTPALCARQGDTLLDSLIFSGQGQSSLTDVWSAGRHVVREGRHVARDTITRRYTETLSALSTAL
ncbi:MAG: formimidoylglutamate deiminase [Pseudomonadota bacterium]